jgi:succinate-semialdehyde dehydrogenase/glutarate-semialdehyde dehydrogenase
MIESNLIRRFEGYINGQWQRASSGQTLPVHNPATGDHLADVPNMGAAETTAAIEAAGASLQKPFSADQRRRWLEQIERLLLENKQELARIITLEQGKPLKESLGEVEYSAGFFRFFAGHLDELTPRQLAERPRGMHWMVHDRPAGVVGLITPWNFPLAMLAKKVAPALGAGCAAVVKPADNTPLTCVALWHLLDEMKLPPGIANLVIGKPGAIGDVICSHPAVRLISFTGSTEVGRLLIQKTSPYVKRLAMELGGNAPYIVMDDADVNAAADALMANKFRCAGQTCVCANRVFVQRGAEKAFTDAISQRVARLKVGNGLEADTDIGPLINREGFLKVQEHVSDAIKHGAMRIVGDDRPTPTQQWGAFYTPTVLTGATSQMLLSRNETFGPVVAIQSFDTDAQAIELANGTIYGLAAYLFTRDQARAQRLVAQLHFGHVGLNTGTGPTPEAPFGGMKQSGFGREGGIEGLLEFCEPQTVVTL